MLPFSEMLLKEFYELRVSGGLRHGHIKNILYKLRLLVSNWHSCLQPQPEQQTVTSSMDDMIRNLDGISFVQMLQKDQGLRYRGFPDRHVNIYFIYPEMYKLNVVINESYALYFIVAPELNDIVITHSS